MQYKRQFAIIEALQYTGTMENKVDLFHFMGYCFIDDNEKLLIKNSDAVLMANIGDYIIKDSEDRFYPCNEALFHYMHEPVAENLDIYPVSISQNEKDMNQNDRVRLMGAFLVNIDIQETKRPDITEEEFEDTKDAWMNEFHTVIQDVLDEQLLERYFLDYKLSVVTEKACVIEYGEF